MRSDHSSGHVSDTTFWVAPPDGFTIGPCIGGRPGITRVFAATDRAGNPCALKTLDPDAATRPLYTARFAREIDAHTAAYGIDGVADACAIVNEEHHHPSGRPNAAWLQVAWAHGGDLATAVTHSTQAAANYASRAHLIIAQLLQTVALLHERRIVHRDIKPSNVLVNGTALWISDFGIAGRGEPRSVTDRTIVWRALPEPWRETRVGTPPWSAPELQGETPQVTAASDVYALAQLWEWLRKGDNTLAWLDQERDLCNAMRDRDPAQRPTARDAAQQLLFATS